MARRPPPPVFLGRASYRQRRLRDGLRLLPILGLVLVMIPLLWPRAAALPEGGAGVSNAFALIYLFAAWAVLIVLALVLSRRLRPEEGEAGHDPDEGGRG